MANAIDMPSGALHQASREALSPNSGRPRQECNVSVANQEDLQTDHRGQINCINDVKGVPGSCAMEHYAVLVVGLQLVHCKLLDRGKSCASKSQACQAISITRRLPWQEMRPFSVPSCAIDSALPLPDRAQRAPAPSLAGLAFTGCRTRMQHLQSQLRSG